jgi:hypothetical protein
VSTGTPAGLQPHRRLETRIGERRRLQAAFVDDLAR